MIILETLHTLQKRTSCLMDYNCFKNYYKMIEIDLRKQQALDADPEAK